MEIDVSDASPQIIFLYDQANKIRELLKPEMSQFDVDKMVKILVNIYIEVKERWNIQLNPKKAFRRIKKELEKNWPELKTKYIDRLENRFYIELNKRQPTFGPYRGIKCINSEYCEYDEIEIFEFQCLNNKDKKRDSSDNVPPSLSVGVTIGLVGYFIYQFPHPTAKCVGGTLMGYSVYQCGGTIFNKQDEDWKAQKEIEKRQRQEEEEESGSDCSICDDKHCPHHDERKKERGY